MPSLLLDNEIRATAAPGQPGRADAGAIPELSDEPLEALPYIVGAMVPGGRLIYHRGRLAIDRHRARVAERADFFLAAGTARGRPIALSESGGRKRPRRGLGFGTLAQVRAEDGFYLYIFIRGDGAATPVPGLT